MRWIDIAWSDEPDFRLEPAPSSSLSLLAVATRAGTILLLRLAWLFSRAQADVDYFTRYDCLAALGSRVQLVSKIEVSKTWISHLSWGHWRASLDDNEKRSCMTIFES